MVAADFPIFAGPPPTKTASAGSLHPLRAAGVSFYQRRRAKRMNTFDSVAYVHSRTLRLYSALGFGALVTLGLMGVSEPGLTVVGQVYLLGAAGFACVLILNEPRRFWQECLLDRLIDNALEVALFPQAVTK